MVQCAVKLLEPAVQDHRGEVKFSLLTQKLIHKMVSQIHKDTRTP